MKTNMKRILAVMFLAVFIIPISAKTEVLNITIDRNATYIDADHVRVTGTITCTPGDRFRIGVNLTTNGGDTQGRGGPDNGNCTGSPVQWKVIVDRDKGPHFQRGTLGEAKAAAQSGTPGDDGANDRKTETRRVEIN